MAKVKLTEVTRRFNNVTAIEDITFEVPDGEFWVLVGPSGCGKSTILRTIAGLEFATSGSLFIGDTLVNNMPARQRDVAMVFQNYALYPHKTVAENLAFGLQMRKIEPKIIKERVEKVARSLDISHLLDRKPKQLSGGQQQRVALGRAIAREPKVFLLDEPLSNLDAKLRAETRAQIVKLQRQLGTTTIYVTHDQTEAMTMGDRIAVMNQGILQQLAKPLELYNSPANMFVAQFIGSPPMNFIPVKYQTPLLINHPQFRFNLPQVWESALRKYDRQSLILGIRPEHFSVGVPAPENLQVEVDLVEALGNETLLSVHLLGETNPNLTLQVRIAPDKQVSIGDKISLALETKKIHLFDSETNLAIFP